MLERKIVSEAELSIAKANTTVMKTYDYVNLGFPKGSVVKNPPANAGNTGDDILILVREDPLEEETSIHSSILASKIPWTRGLVYSSP